MTFCHQMKDASNSGLRNGRFWPPSKRYDNRRIEKKCNGVDVTKAPVYFFLNRGTQYCNQHVCLSVCLSRSARVSQKQHVQISPNFLCILPVTVARSFSDDNVICTSGFVNDVTSAHNEANMPKNFIYVLAFVHRFGQ